MVYRIIFSSLFLSLSLLVPLGIKWEIPKRISIPASILIGFITGSIVTGLLKIIKISPYQIIALQLLFIGGISLTLLLWRFYRDPDRIPPDDHNAILSPADGKVIYVKKIENGEIPYSEKNGKKFLLTDFTQSRDFLGDGYLIGISMNFLDVHINRAPIEGQISFLKHIKGHFISLKKDDALLQNERAFTIIENRVLKIGLVQIASRLVRNILVFVKEGSQVKKGQRIGAIRFGSQVDLILPKGPSIQITVNLGDKVKAGTSIVARIL